MQQEAEWWRRQAELAEDMANGFLGYWPDGERLLDYMRAEREAAEAVIAQRIELNHRWERLHMPLKELQATPEAWAAVKRDVAAARAGMKQAATVTLDALITGLLDKQPIEWLRVALKAHDDDAESQAMLACARGHRPHGSRMQSKTSESTSAACRCRRQKDS